MEDVVRKRVNRMNRVYKKLRDVENRAMTTGSRDYLHGLIEIRELQMIMSNPLLKYFFTSFVSRSNQLFHDFQLASVAMLEQTATPDDPTILQLTGVQTLLQILERNKRTINLENDIEEVMKFVESMPDREIVIMQVARHLALAAPYKHVITGKQRPQNTASFAENDSRDPNNPYVIIDCLVSKLLEEWVGSICNVFGKSAMTSVRAALDDDVLAQVRPSNAAQLIVSCVWGLDASF
ncbi:hypothetical protein RFI_15849 [Reticulomyxa filosa]|uniref:Uncharacterized protein n=1 Tax=Reticulomyxa filosa TaxID=46433 RepID=X6N6H2_RETFI|nr:hypothetical protein RFI_15849 [Reticulomyxa filosa]|eukprot:ETO21354.1 hypothetical protein RFI_15849 [Reticulomyxa filosa]